MAFWDFLRPLTQAAVNVNMATSAIVFLLSLAILAVSLIAYKRTKNKKLAFVSLAFALFAVKWALKIIDLMVSPGEFFHRAAENLFELVILASLFMALFRK